ncbi:hypothetical protein ACM26V_15145 [Salipaludibacillus sp. HK11]|uniref:hypothetical protein n=1 Tax=Salipaludibacillus sp. HK11 TaxID=3394320 RepID=UPI0039FCCE1D
MVKKKLTIFMVFLMFFSLFASSGVFANATTLNEEESEFPTFNFDFGTESSPVAEGYTKVSELTEYSSEKGFGLELVRAGDSRDQNDPSDLLRDFVLASGNTFKVDVPNGEYEVLIVTGSQFDNNRTSYSLQGDEVKGGDRSGAGEFITYEEDVSVEDGQVAISFSNEWARINAVQIVPLGVEESTDEPVHYQFDFGSATSPVEDGYTQVASDLVYEETIGYGLDQVVDSRNREGPDDLRRDFTIFTGNYEFKVDLPNGEYDVHIISGDEDAGNRTGFIIEGEDKGNTHVGSGNYIEFKETITIEDGQLNIEVTNDRRINGIEIVQVADEEGNPFEPTEPADPTDPSEPTEPSEPELIHSKFDFGSTSSPVEDGYLQVTNTMVYSEERGYGLDKEVGYRDRSGPDDLRRDFTNHDSNYEFKVDLPNGEYDVLIISGDDAAANRTGFIIEGEDKGNTHVASENYIEFEDTITVEDAQLNIEVTNDRRINGIEIVQVSVEEEAPTHPDEPFYLMFDFGNGPVADGYQQVTNTTLYNEEIGYGINKNVAERDRGEPDDLRRDFILDGNYEFKADIPNGEYFVRIIAGDTIAFNRSSFIVEGENLGNVTSGAGSFGVLTHTVNITDGQLNVEIGENGRINGLEIMTLTEISSLEVSDLSFSPETVHLSWDEDSSAASFNVYRKEEGQDSFTLIGNTTEASFDDEDVQLGHTYTYAVTAVNEFGVESPRSNEVTAAVVDESVQAPISPDGLSVGDQSQGEVTFSWNGVDNAVRYHVYRTRYNPEDFPDTNIFERIGETEHPTFTDEDIFSPNPYYYVVRAVNEGGISEASHVLEAQEREKLELRVCGAGEFDAEVIEMEDGSWQVINDDVIYTGHDMLEAMQTAVDSLTPDRTTQESVVVRGSGTIPTNASLDLPSHTSFEVCGTIHVEGQGEFDYDNHQAPVRIRYAENVSVPYLNLTGSPNFGIYVRTSEDIHLGQIDLRLDSGLGIRIDSRDDDSVYGTRNVQIDNVYVSGTSAHGVETYGVDGISIGTVTAVNTGYSGVLLNDTINADVDAVYGFGAGTGTGYAAFRMANRNGHIDDEYTTNNRIGEVVARGGGRGIFSVSRSGGAVIEYVDIANTGNNAILLENGYNIAIKGGIVEGPSGIRIAARDDMPNNSDILMENLTVRNSEIVESPCGDNIVFRNITLDNSTANICSEIEDAIEPEDPSDPGDDEPGTDPGNPEDPVDRPETFEPNEEGVVDFNEENLVESSTVTVKLSEGRNSVTFNGSILSSKNVSVNFEIEDENGKIVKVTIPANVFEGVTGDVTYTVSKVNKDNITDGDKVKSNVYQFTLEGMDTSNFAEAVTIEIPVDSQDNPDKLVIRYFNETSEQWEDILDSVSYDEEREVVIGKTTHFSIFAVFEESAQDSGNGEAGTDPGDEPGTDPGTNSGDGDTDPGESDTGTNSGDGDTDPGESDTGTNSGDGDIDPGESDTGTDSGDGGTEPGEGDTETVVGDQKLPETSTSMYTMLLLGLVLLLIGTATFLISRKTGRRNCTQNI